MPADPSIPAPNSTPPADAAPVAALPVPEVARLGSEVLDRVSTVVVGMRDPLRIAFATILAGGHVLFEDVPGLGKTLAARSIAAAVGLDFRRLQCTPDLLPSDITGSFVYVPRTAEFEFRPGPVFTGLFLADEINRTSPKTQSALLEAMAEGQVSVEGRSFPLPTPFHVVATANPIESEGTYALPEAQLDRFMVRLSVGYPDEAGESRVLLARVARRHEVATVEPVIDAATLSAMQAGVEAVDVDPDIADYCVRLAAATRRHRSVEVGASPRGSQGLLLVARALAVLDGRDFVLPDDVKAVAVPVLAHRLTLTVQAWTSGVGAEQVVIEVVNSVAGPPAVGAAQRAEAARG
ncbi:AAA family ATPase [Leifsonia sp. 22587]|uniref:AAA family ATPase n=1 Tax=Leifsonia sp. 22587 TaxID=3453946 RepID=UPI003F873422